MCLKNGEIKVMKVTDLIVSQVIGVMLCIGILVLCINAGLSMLTCIIISILCLVIIDLALFIIDGLRSKGKI